MSNSDSWELRPKLGRPLKPPEIRRCKRVVTFLREKDYAELQALAAARRLSLSALCDELIVKALHEE